MFLCDEERNTTAQPNQVQEIRDNSNPTGKPRRPIELISVDASESDMYHVYLMFSYFSKQRISYQSERR